MQQNRPLPRHTKAPSWHTQSKLVAILAHVLLPHDPDTIFSSALDLWQPVFHSPMYTLACATSLPYVRPAANPDRHPRQSSPSWAVCVDWSWFAPAISDYFYRMAPVLPILEPLRVMKAAQRTLKSQLGIRIQLCMICRLAIMYLEERALGSAILF
jgi:hypothetical protein